MSFLVIRLVDRILHAWYLTQKISQKYLDKKSFPCSRSSNAIGNAQNPQEALMYLGSHLSLKHRDVVADPVFLVLSDALRDPGDVADFLEDMCQLATRRVVYSY